MVDAEIIELKRFSAHHNNIEKKRKCIQTKKEKKRFIESTLQKFLNQTQSLIYWSGVSIYLSRAGIVANNAKNKIFGRKSAFLLARLIETTLYTMCQ